MKLSYPELIEDGEWFETFDGEHTIFGHICDDERTIARYFASWSHNFPAQKIVFDIVFGQLASGQTPDAVSLVRYALSDPSFQDATSRPFAKTLALYCNFPTPTRASDDLAVNSLITVNFILKHDTRLLGCFASRA